MMKKIIFILIICFTIMSCKKPIEKFNTKPIYEISAIKSVDLIEKDYGAFIGLITGGFGGMIVGNFTENTINKLDLDIKNKKVKVCLTCIEPNDLKYPTIEFDVDVSDIIILNWKIGDKVEFYKNVNFNRYINEYGRTFCKTSVVCDYHTTGIQYYKKIVE